MRFRTKLVAWAVVMSLVLMIGFSTIPPAKAQFVIAGWDYPDEYGQGIVNFEIWENSTSIWLLETTYAHSDVGLLDWNANASIWLKCYTWFNSTLTGSADVAEGKNYQRHNVTVMSGGEAVFSQNNFTYIFGEDAIDPPMWYYGYSVVLNFLPVSGAIYTVTITYEVFY